MESSPQSPTAAVPAWLQSGPNIWETFLIHFPRILKITLAVMLVAAGISLLLPKTYRANSTLLVLPPRYVETLEVPPKTLSMPSVQAIATSYPVMQDLLADLAVKREFVQRLKKLGGLEEMDAGNPMTATRAAETLGVPLTDRFRKAWQGMPPPNLLKGFDSFSDRDLEDLDPIELSKVLSAKISTTLETNLTTEYQPVLTLSSDWKTPEGAALLSHLWAGAVMRAWNREIVETSLQRQIQKKAHLSENLQRYRQARMAPFEYLAHHPVEVWMSELEGWPKTGSAAESSKVHLAELERKIEETLSTIQNLREAYHETSREFRYTLEQMGGVESLLEDYSLILGIRSLGTPLPPKKKIRPKRAAIVLVSGVLAFVLALGYCHVVEFRRSS